MKNKWVWIVIMWISYGILNDYIPILHEHIFSFILKIMTICLIFDIFPKIHIYYLEKKLLKKINKVKTICLNNNTTLQQPSSDYCDIEVYYNKEKICQFVEFKQYDEMKYKEFMKKLLKVKESQEEVEVEEKVILPFINEIEQIESYNIEITDEALSLGLYHCANQLKYLQQLLIKEAKESQHLHKLKSYYLPILFDILENYTKVVKTNHENSLHQKLSQTISMVNEAIRTITHSLFEDDAMNLKVDMNVLEKLLKKDGLVLEKNQTKNSKMEDFYE